MTNHQPPSTLHASCLQLSWDIWPSVIRQRLCSRLYFRAVWEGERIFLSRKPHVTRFSWPKHSKMVWFPPPSHCHGRRDPRRWWTSCCKSSQGPWVCVSLLGWYHHLSYIFKLTFSGTWLQVCRMPLKSGCFSAKILSEHLSTQLLERHSDGSESFPL